MSLKLYVIQTWLSISRVVDGIFCPRVVVWRDSNVRQSLCCWKGTAVVYLLFNFIYKAVPQYNDTCIKI